jgi:hypothetical protein
VHALSCLEGGDTERVGADAEGVMNGLVVSKKGTGRARGDQRTHIVSAREPL